MASTELRQRKKNKEDEEPDKQEESPERQKSPMEIAQEKYRKFFTRSLWGSLMIIVFAVILLSDHFLVCLFVVLLQIMVFKEMIALRYQEAKEKNLPGFRTIHWYFLFGTFFFVYGYPVLQKSVKLIPLRTLEVFLRYHLAISFALYVIGFIAFIATLKKGLLKYQFGQFTWTLMTLLIVVGQSNFIIQNIFKGLFWFLLPCSLIICNDIMAYICGLLFGRRFVDKPLTSLSPNKTWEGFIGSLLCTLIFGFFFSRFLSQYEWFICPKEYTYDKLFDFRSSLHCTPNPIFVPSLTYSLPFGSTTITVAPIQFHALAFALFASVIAPFGGFFASGIKRAYNIKDFNSLFPGHGGVTDRMDCQFIMGLFAYVYHVTVVSSASLDVDQILYHIAELPLDQQMVVFDNLKKLLAIS